LAVEHHHLVAQMHEQVFITIERLIQGWQKRLLYVAALSDACASSSQELFDELLRRWSSLR
jgi:hypothetical protein